MRPLCHFPPSFSTPFPSREGGDSWHVGKSPPSPHGSHAYGGAQDGPVSLPLSLSHLSRHCHSGPPPGHTSPSPVDTPPSPGSSRCVTPLPYRQSTVRKKNRISVITNWETDLNILVTYTTRLLPSERLTFDNFVSQQCGLFYQWSERTKWACELWWPSWVYRVTGSCWWWWWSWWWWWTWWWRWQRCAVFCPSELCVSSPGGALPTQPNLERLKR